MNDSAVNEFLNAQKKSTATTYKTQIRNWLEFNGKTGSELIEAKKAEKNFETETSLFAFKKWLIERKNLAEGSAVSTLGAIRGFYAYYRVPLQLRRQESKKLNSAARKTTDYLFDKEDLARMALAGDLKSRYVLLVGKSVGLRASDFLTFNYGTFRSLKLDSEAPIALGCMNTIKENVRANPFLDSDAVPIIRQILESNRETTIEKEVKDEETGKLKKIQVTINKDSDKILNDTEDNLSVILQTLCKKAGMEIDEHGMIHGKRVRFHNLRKYTIDHLSAYASESQWKQIIGKAIQEGAYVSTDQLRKIFERAMSSMLINGNGAKVRKLIELENAMGQLEKENSALKTRIDLLQKENEKLRADMTETTKTLTDLAERLIYIEKKTKIRKPLYSSTEPKL